MSLYNELIVKPNSQVKLKKIDPSYHAQYENEEHAKATLEKHVEKIGELQRKLYGEKKHALLIVLQGIDAAGKDGTCWHVMNAMNAQGTSVHGFKQPTSEEKQHDFLWRIHPHTPGLGEVAIFNRSHYEDVLIQRVHNIVPKKVWSQRYEHINNFETLLENSQVTILKFFLYISPEEQLERFKQRLDDPERQWKISDSDYTERQYWDQYILAYEDMLNKCSTERSPWFIIPSNHKWFRNLAISEIILKTLEGLKLKLPEPEVDLEKIRSEYHQIIEAEQQPVIPKKSKKAAKK